MSTGNNTLDYYNEKAVLYIKDTQYVDFSVIQNEFVSLLTENMDAAKTDRARILDLGCGSGRDSKAFLELGFDVTAVDGSEELARMASMYINHPVICATFAEFEPRGMYDGIWACSSLLHLGMDDLKAAMKKYTLVLKEGGVFYVSFKYGTFAGERNGRWFTDLNEDSFASILAEIPQVKLLKMFITQDVRPGRKSEMWLNAFLRKKG